MSKQQQTAPQETKQWSVDLTLREQDIGYNTLQSIPQPLNFRKMVQSERHVENDVASSSGDGPSSNTMAKVVLAQKKKAKAMEVAMSPGRQILMNGFMMYMSGKNLNIFSISITSMAMLSPLKALLSLGTTFLPYSDPDGKVDLQLPKFVFVALNLIWFGVGLYKMGSMRLLPTTSADWAGRVVWKEMEEMTSIPAI
mmetsp:Transcript_602/g.789  ORF Transcript_602/g.789 Transcript_602/m.789 type:complete len:197 (+) Transcript_602:95-685(+)|eukprot:CAMPEP_0172495412 /NCGR_PEP_ID=MMETSP1066-20121228/69961_1 /TAXON_ID=671091 /ORGANISM="Coscinodiscus wailesii, Strain CCMP2513" /LENGTH=196 /DNA_ID=CAMNT_0013267059 /DNA_START=80 /DNA_END=670 /DNA_ORIENTATION=-